jgi:hypothetical protein
MGDPDRLDEQARRRPDFRGGVPVTLADGQEWYLPRPRKLFVADDSEAGFRLRWDLGDEYGRLFEAARSIATFEDMVRAEFALAKYLLRLNYDLDAAALGRLLVFDYADDPDPALERLRAELIEVTSGRAPAPKPGPATSG